MSQATRLVVPLAAIALYLGYVSATIEYNPAAYLEDKRELHEAVFKGSQPLTSQDVFDSLKHLRRYLNYDIVDEELDDLIRIGQVKAYKCQGRYLKDYKAAMVKYAESSVSLKLYLSDYTHSQAKICSELLLTALSERIGQTGVRAMESMSSLFVRYKIGPNEIDRIGRVQAYSQYIIGEMGPMDIFISETGSKSFGRYIMLSLGRVREHCRNIGLFVNKRKEYFNTVLTLYKLSSQDNSKLDTWLTSCEDLLGADESISNEVEQLIRHQSHRMDLEIWRLSAGGHLVVPHEWRNVKLQIYKQQVEPTQILNVEVTRQRLEMLNQIQEKDILGIFKPFSSNFEQELLSLSHVTDDKCRDVFPSQYKYLQRRHASEPNIMAYLENYYNIQLVVCMSKLKENVDITIMLRDLKSDMAIIGHILATYKEMLFSSDPEATKDSIMIRAVVINIHTDDANSSEMIKDRLTTVKSSCQRITSDLSNYVDTMLAIKEQEFTVVLDDNLVGELELVQFCQDFLKIQKDELDSSVTEAEGSSRKRAGEDLDDSDRGKGKQKL